MHNLFIWIIIRKLRLPMLIIILTFSITIIGMVLIPGVDNNGKVYHLSIFDAFYFVSYMASTIGFGESPYSFTYPQKLWVSFSIYSTVIGWFYGIGTIVSLVQDKVLALEIARARFIKSIKNFKEPFILVFGYNSVTKELIEKLNDENRRMVVIDKAQDKIEEMALENYYPYIPGFVADAMDTKMLEMAGVKSKNCEVVIVVFEEDNKNTTIAMKCKYLNKNISLFVRSSSVQNNIYLRSLGVEHIENPFKVISKRLELAIEKPSIWRLEAWIYGKDLKVQPQDRLPEGKFIIYGYGRMGRALEEGLKKSDKEYIFIDSNEIFGSDEENDEMHSSEIMEKELLSANVKKAAVIIAATRDDMVNLAVITIAKKFNPNIYTIARENDLVDAGMFESIGIDRNYILEDIVTNKIYNYIAMPLASEFLKLVYSHDEKWGKALVERIVSKLGYSPSLFDFKIDLEQTYAVYNALKAKEVIKLEVLKRSRENYKKHIPLIFLVILRGKKRFILPNDDFDIKIGDEVLIACDEQSENDLSYVLNNFYELYYAMHGREKVSGILGMINGKG